MALTISANDAVSQSSDSSSQAFDKAIENAQSSDITPELEEVMINGAITVGGQMIIMPRANDILNEAMSDE